MHILIIVIAHKKGKYLQILTMVKHNQVDNEGRILWILLKVNCECLELSTFSEYALMFQGSNFMILTSMVLG